MKNILFISSSPIDPTKGGVQRVTYTLAAEFKKSNLEAYFLSLSPMSEANIKDHRQLYLSRTGLSFAEKKIELEKILKKHRIYTVINQAGIYKDVIDLMSTIPKQRIKLITVHHNCVSCLNKRYREIVLNNRGNSTLWKFLDKPLVWKILSELNRRKYGTLFKNAIKNSHALVLLSKSFIPELRHYGIKGNLNKVMGIPNPAPFKTDEVLDIKKENRIIFVGRLVKGQKRVDRLMHIWKDLHERLPNWHFDIVGDGKDRSWMENFCRSHKMDRVHFHGYRDPQPFLSKAKIFTMTSDFEGFGMVLVEAQAFGVVPIAFNCFSSIDDIITNRSSGRIIPAFDQDLYIKEVTDLARNKDGLKFMSINCRQEVKRYDAALVSKIWIKEFDLNEGH